MIINVIIIVDPWSRTRVRDRLTMMIVLCSVLLFHTLSQDCYVKSDGGTRWTGERQEKTGPNVI